MLDATWIEHGLLKVRKFGFLRTETKPVYNNNTQRPGLLVRVRSYDSLETQIKYKPYIHID